jgi:hypothetical protein
MNKRVVVSILSAIIALAIIVVAVVYVEDMDQKITISVTAALVFVAIQQAFSTYDSAKAAKDSAKSASIAQEQAIYAHLADLWYTIKLKGLENDYFIDPQFTSSYRQRGVHGDKYRKYHVYAWLCWGHAEDCYKDGFHEKPSFKPSIINYKELHYVWFCVHKNRNMFSEKFIEWIDKLEPDTVEVRSQGTLHGNGVFAKQKFREDDFIGFFEGEEVASRTDISVQFGTNFHVGPFPPFRNLNHSCDANAFFRGRNLYARRQIDKGQEITIDYNCSEFELDTLFQCNCGTEACVGTIKGYKFLSQDERERRAAWVPNWLKEMGNTTSAAPGP